MKRVSTIAVGSSAKSLGDLADALKELAGAGHRGDRMKTAVERAARLAGLSYWRAFNIWYGKAAWIEDSERAGIAMALAAKRREAARNEVHEIKVKLARLETMLSTIDPEFHREAIDHLGSQLRELDDGGRAVDRPVAEKQVRTKQGI